MPLSVPTAILPLVIAMQRILLLGRPERVVKVSQVWLANAEDENKVISKTKIRVLYIF
jgi:hypothetical protein